MAKTSTDQWLQNFVDKGGKVERLDTGETVDKDNLDQFLSEVGQGQDVGTEKTTNLQKRAEKLQAANEERLQREQAAAEKERIDEAVRQQAEKDQTLQQGLRNAQSTISQNIGAAIDKVGSFRTYGGIGLLIAVLAILLFIVVQVNAEGDTRMKQIWYMLNGRATLQGRVTPTGAISGGAGSTFGTQTPTPTTPTAGYSGLVMDPIVNGNYRSIGTLF